MTDVDISILSARAKLPSSFVLGYVRLERANFFTPKREYSIHERLALARK
jgi:hypothetical protein